MSSVQAITATAKDWIAALTRLSPAMAGKKPIPVLYSIHIDPASGALSGYDYETSAVTSLSEFDGAGSPFLVTYRWLIDGIRSTTGRAKTTLVTLAQDGDKITLSANGYELHAEAQKLDDYPELPDVYPGIAVELPAAELRAALRRVSTAASKDDTLPILTAVQFNVKDGAVELLATDRYRLAEDHVTGSGVGEVSFLLQGKTIKALDRFLVGETVLISVHENRVRIQTEDALYTTTSTDGTYPDLKTLFPASVTGSFEFDRGVLLESAKVAQRMNERYSPCYIRMSEAGAEVTFSYGIFGPTKAPAAAGGVVAGSKDEIIFALNPNYLVETLQQIPGEQVRISYTTLPKPFMFQPAGREANDQESIKHLIMPVRMPS